MSVSFCGLELDHPVINGSGTFDAIAAHRAFGEQLLLAFPFAAFVSKTITLHPRPGNPPPRLWEAQSGLINSIGLPNKGLDRYIEEDLPLLSRLPVPLITNVMGTDAQEITVLLQGCQRRPEIAAVELNVSCPNVKNGLDLGSDPRMLQSIVSAVRPNLSKPLIVKLTPNTADVVGCARAAEAGGADAVSLINTLRAMAHAPDRSGPWLGGRTGGLSGAAIRTVALAHVAAVADALAIPVVGMGGVTTADHARDLLDVGATLVGIGTESFRDPAAGSRIAAGLRRSDPHRVTSDLGVSGCESIAREVESRSE